MPSLHEDGVPSMSSSFRGVQDGLGVPEMPENSAAYDAFELFGRAANVSTQTAIDSQWLQDTLEEESGNFLHFVEAAVHARKEAHATGPLDEAAEDAQNAGISFEMLLPPSTNSRVVAAQGLLHTLSLASKGLLVVEQEDAFGALWMVVP